MEQHLDLEFVIPGMFRWFAPVGWNQGRGLWGGLVVAACVKAVEMLQQEQDESRSIRSVGAHLFGAVPSGSCTVEVSCLRAGSAMSTWQTIIRGASDETYATATVVTGAARPNAHTPAAVGVRAPDVPSWRDASEVPIGPPYGPEFSRNLRYRPVEGFPGSAADPRTLGWIQRQDTGHTRAWTAASLLGIVDAWWPATYASFPSVTALRPMATVAFHGHLLEEPGTVPASEPLLFESWVNGAWDGFVSESRRLWTKDGRLVVENTQNIVVVA